MKNDFTKHIISPKLYILVILFLMFSSCQKQEDFLLIKGSIISINEGVSLEGVVIELYTRELQSGIYSANYKLFNELTTASDGNFVFTLPRRTWASVHLLFSKPGYFNWDFEIEGDVLKSDSGFDEVFSLDPKSWLNFEIRNANPVNGSDSFEYRIMNGTADCEKCCTGNSQSFSGMDVNENGICEIIGSQDIIIQWNLFRNGQNTGGSNSYFIPPGDTALINFAY